MELVTLNFTISDYDLSRAKYRKEIQDKKDFVRKKHPNSRLMSVVCVNDTFVSGYWVVTLTFKIQSNFVHQPIIERRVIEPG